jgi:hypothetical protein
MMMMMIIMIFWVLRYYFEGTVTASIIRVPMLQMCTAGSLKFLIPFYQAVCHHNPAECDVSSFN